MLCCQGYLPGTCSGLLKWKPPSLNTVDFRLAIVEDDRPGYAQLLSLCLPLTLCACVCATHTVCMCMCHSHCVHVYVPLTLCACVCATHTVCMCMCHSHCVHVYVPLTLCACVCATHTVCMCMCRMLKEKIGQLWVGGYHQPFSVMDLKVWARDVSC